MNEKNISDCPTNFDKINKTFLETSKGLNYTFDAIPDLIAVLDTNHKIVKVNRAMAEKLNTTPASCIGILCYQAIHQSENPPENCPHSMLLKDGLEHTSEVYEKNLGGYFIVSTSPIKDDDDNLIGSIHIAHDITKRKEIEKNLEKTIEEKDILMKEIYHRVKNNLMVLSSLLNLQSRYYKDKDIEEVFKEIQHRAKSMALIHERLYKSDDLKHINFTEYLETLAKDLYNAYTSDKSLIKLILKIEEVELDVDISIPLGLILNEILTNSLKYAFPNGRSGEIKIELYKNKEEKIQLSVSDNGIGFPADLDYEHSDSLGMLIINSLTDQIDGKIMLEQINGTKFTVIFENQEC